VKLIAERAGAAATKPTGMRFQRVEAAGHAAEVTIPRAIGTATGIGKTAAYRAVIAAPISASWPIASFGGQAFKPC
jgi:hypothetical protein